MPRSRTCRRRAGPGREAHSKAARPRRNIRLRRFTTKSNGRDRLAKGAAAFPRIRNPLQIPKKYDKMTFGWVLCGSRRLVSGRRTFAKTGERVGTAIGNRLRRQDRPTALCLSGEMSKWRCSPLGSYSHLVSLPTCLTYQSSIPPALARLKTNTRGTAWIVAACLPVPSNPKPDMEEGDGGASQHDTQASATHRRSAMAETSRHEGALWWRRLNRYMSVVGLLVIGAVIALVVVGVRQRWGS